MAQQKLEITANFRLACEKCLNPGDIAHETCFSLQHAMSAIEIMNPSMDISITKSRKVYYLHEAIDSGYLCLDIFSDFSLLLGVIDELLSSFVNWITGDSLVQTVYTCMYMHCISLIQDKYLSAFCEGFRRCLYNCREILLSSPVFEEEDFCGLTHGVPLNRNTSEIFSNMPHSNTLFSYSNKEIDSLLMELEQEIVYPSDCGNIRKLISIRLHFLRCFLEMLIDILPIIKENENDADINDVQGFSTNGCIENSPPHHKSELSLKEIRDISLSVEKSTEELIHLSSEMLSSASMGTSAGKGKLKPKTHYYGLPGFEPFLMQANLPSTVQKTSVILERPISFNFFKCLFTRLNFSISKLCYAIICDDLRFVSVHDLLSLLHNVGHHCCHSVCDTNKDGENSIESNNKSCLLSRSILNIFTVAILQCHPNVPEAVHSLLCTAPASTNMVLSWINIESSIVQKAILRDISVIGRFNSFFDLVGSQFLLISRNFCFNRSRQRSNMERIFCHMHELLEDSCSVENAIVFSISELQQQEQQPNLPLQRTPITLHLAAYICYFYYHLAWDYIDTGFQLDLYSCHEWVYMYSFCINVLRSLSNLLQHIANPLLEGEMNSKHLSANGSNRDSIPTPKRSGKGRRRRGQLTETKDVQRSSAEDSSIVYFELPSVSINYWKYQISMTNVHRFILTATIYTMRALQRDLGIDLSHLSQNPHCSPSSELPCPRKRMFYGSVCTQFLHRLGVLISSPTSPLAEAGGALAAFKSTHEYLISSHFMDCSTTDLYQLASKMFAVARQWIKNSENLLQSLVDSSSAGDSLYSHMTPLGPIDPLEKLDHLAKNNDIVSRLLAACSEKRPKLKPSDNPYQPDILSTLSSIKFDFHFLASKLYPLFKLTNT